MKKRVLCILLYLILGCAVYAQMTIGSTAQPEDAVLLELKTIDTPSGGSDGATTDTNGGGLLLPKVQLSALNNFLPFMDKLSTENYAAEALKHTGLMVYNINETTELQKGLYVWDGEKWILAQLDNMLFNTVWFLSGNSGTNESNDFIGTTDSKPVTFKTNNSSVLHIGADGKVGINHTSPTTSLHVGGDVTLKDVAIQVNSKALGIDANNKLNIVEITRERLPGAFYLQSTVKQDITGTELTQFETGVPCVAKWTTNEILLNTLNLPLSNHMVTIQKTSYYTISGFVNYRTHNSSSQFGNYTSAIVSVQYQRSGSSAWTDIVTAAEYWADGSMSSITQTIALPEKVIRLSANDKIRLIVRRSAKGLNHGRTGTPGIDIPQGAIFSKCLKIVEMAEYVPLI